MDLAILAWGSDFLRVDERWSTARAGRTNYARDPFRLRQNVYRVLLTRGRDGSVIFLPPRELFEETAAFLQRAGGTGADGDLKVPRGITPSPGQV